MTKKDRIIHPREMFHIAYDGGHNFMTPEGLAWGYIGSTNQDFAVFELSRGEGLVERRPIFGVTVLVVRKVGTAPVYLKTKSGDQGGPNGCFSSEADAREHIDGLRAKVKDNPKTVLAWVRENS